MDYRIAPVNYDLFFSTAILIGAGINLVLGLIIALVANIYRNKAIYLVSNNVVNMKKALTNLIVTNPMFKELQKIIQQKNMPIIIISETVSKKRIKATLINKEIAEIDKKNILLYVQDVTERTKNQLDNYLFWSDYLTAISVILMFLGTFSLIFLATPTSVRGLVLLIFMTIFVLLLIPFGKLVNYNRKRRNIKIVE